MTLKEPIARSLQGHIACSTGTKLYANARFVFLPLNESRTAKWPELNPATERDDEVNAKAPIERRDDNCNWRDRQERSLATDPAKRVADRFWSFGFNLEIPGGSWNTFPLERFLLPVICGLSLAQYKNLC